MTKTIKEIVEMIDAGELHFEQSTQRQFVYNTIDTVSTGGVKLTKAGALIKAVLDNNIRLPGLMFWHNTDTNQLNIHDGKQRVLSFYYFIKNTPGISISSDIKGKRICSFDFLSKEDQDKLLNYKFDITCAEGNSEEEEKNFYAVNTNSLPLTNYECLRGMFYGAFFTTFENYIDAMSRSYDSIKPIRRGEQAYLFLLVLFDILNIKQRLDNDKAITILCDKLRPIRHHSFVPKDYRFDDILKIFNELNCSHGIGIKEDKALVIAAYIIRNNYDIDKVLNLYRESIKKRNDIDKWSLDVHKIFIDTFVSSGLKLDPMRFFTKDDKSVLYSKISHCMFCDENGYCSENNFNKLEVDHKIPWSKGGLTILDNAQLLCKIHNTSKGNN